MTERDARIAQKLCEALYLLGAIDGKIYNQIRKRIFDLTREV